MKKLLLIIAIALISVPTNAQWGKRVKGNGKQVTIHRTVGDYESIAVAGSYEVELVAGNEGDLTLSGEENLLEHIVTEVKGGKLTIKTEKYFNLIPSWNKSKITVVVPVEAIDAITLSGSGSIATDLTLKSDHFHTTVSGSGDIKASVDTQKLGVTVSGSGDITLKVKATDIDVQIAGSGDSNLSGTTNNIDVNVSGSGDLSAFSLMAKTAEVNIAGSADVEVYASDILHARIVGSGDIRYKGNPKVDSRIVGSGDLIKN